MLKFTFTERRAQVFRKNKLPELLSPAGDMECLYAAVAAGADAVYVGGKRFGARAFAKNFDIDELSSAVNYCHLHGVKLYVTLNTLIEDKELSEAVEYAATLYSIGVDALIVADLGVCAAIRRCVPGLELHGSTQMSVHNTDGAVAAAELGMSRVVLARELPLSEIKSAVNGSPVEIEVFLHGALCVCYSGQCLFSSLVGGRSGNRGECAQPCRLPYNGSYPLSLKDLSLANHIPELIESGVSSLKIEGRMKAPSYVFAVTSIYRRLLDEGRAATREENELLRRAFSRGGFTDGYLTDKTEKNMIGVRSREDKEDSRSIDTRSFSPIKVKVGAEVTMRLGEPSKMTVFDGKRSVSVLGEIPVEAQNAPLTEQSVKERLSKMGNTLLSLSPEDISLSLDEGINLPPSAINALRRSAAAAFESSARELCRCEYRLPESPERGEQLLTAQFFSEREYLKARDAAPELVEKIDIAFLPLMGEGEDYQSNGVYLPPVVFDREMRTVKEALEKAKKQGVKYALVSNIGIIEIVKQSGLVPIGDFRLNITNRESSLVYREMGVVSPILSPELTLPKARDAVGGLITYGRIPLMLTERCFMRENFGCKSCGGCSLTDRKGEKFPMLREFDHRNLILNSVPTYMGDRGGELSEYRIYHRHLLFTVESGRQIADILRANRSVAPLSGDRVRRVGRR